MAQQQSAGLNWLLFTVLLEIIFYTFLWLWNEGVAFFVSLAFSLIALFILVIALIAEWIEPSRVPKVFFKVMAVSVLLPWVLVGIFILFSDLNISALKNERFF